MNRRTYRPGTLRRRPDGRYWFDVRIGGKRFIRILGLDKSRAQLELNKLKHEKGSEAAAGEADASSSPDFRARVPFDSIADSFFAKYCQGKKSERRYENSLVHLRAFFGNKLFSNITPLDIEEYKGRRLAETYERKEVKHYSKACINRELAALKRMLSWAEDIAEISIPMPIKKIKLFSKKEAEHPRERILSDEEQAILLTKAPSHLKPIILTALWTGMRLGEILSLQWTDLRLSARLPEIVVRGENSKSGKTRKIPIIPKLSRVLAALPRTTDYVFFNPETKKPWTSIKRSFGTARRRAKIKDARFHDLRHTFATMCIEHGVDLVTLQQWMGHSTIMMTARYVKAGSEAMRQKMEKIADPLPEELERKVESVASPASVYASKQALYA